MAAARQASIAPTRRRSDLWTTDLERGTASRLTHGGVNVAPVWSADGARVFFASGDGGPLAIFARDADALRPTTELHRGPEHAIPCSASPDGSLLAFVARGAGTRADIWGLPLAGGPVQPLIRTPFDDVAAAFSPDGGSIAYQSNDAGRWEVLPAPSRRLQARDGVRRRRNTPVLVR